MTWLLCNPAGPASSLLHLLYEYPGPDSNPVSREYAPVQTSGWSAA